MTTEKRMLLDRILLYASVVVVIVLGIRSFNSTGNRKIAFVDIVKLTDGYKFKKDMEVESTKNLNRIKNAIDSLKMVRKITGGMQPKIDTMLYSAERAFQQYYAESNKQISQKVWERLNPAIEQYGKEKGMQLIIGANGAGTVLYGDTGNDITENLTAYLNAKYEKGN